LLKGFAFTGTPGASTVGVHSSRRTVSDISATWLP